MVVLLWVLPIVVVLAVLLGMTVSAKLRTFVGDHLLGGTRPPSDE